MSFECIIPLLQASLLTLRGGHNMLCTLLCDTKLEFLLRRAGTVSISLEILIIGHTMYERMDEVVNCSDVEVKAPIARLLLPFIVGALCQIARRHFGQLFFSQVLM